MTRRVKSCCLALLLCRLCHHRLLANSPPTRLSFYSLKNNDNNAQVKQPTNKFCWLEESPNEFWLLLLLSSEVGRRKGSLLLSRQQTIEQVQQGVYSAPIIIWSVNCVGFFLSRLLLLLLLHLLCDLTQTRSVSHLLRGSINVSPHHCPILAFITLDDNNNTFQFSRSKEDSIHTPSQAIT